MEIAATTSGNSPVCQLEDVLVTPELARRKAPTADFKAESAAMFQVAQQMLNAPGTALQTLANTAMSLCDAGTAGVSLLDPEAHVFRWVAVAGEYADHLGDTTPEDFSPCGTCLSLGSPQLYSNPARYFTYLKPALPPVAEALLIPFRTTDVVGTIWVVSHDDTRFTSEDVRIVTSLGNFAGVLLLAHTSWECAERERSQKAALAAAMIERQGSIDALHGAQTLLDERVRRATSELTTMNEVLKTEAVNRVRLDRELQHALAHAKKASHAKDQFLAALSHELRTPLSPALMTIVAMETSPELPEALRADATMIRRNIELEARLIDDLLDLSRVTSGKLRLDLQPTRVHDLLQHIVRNAASDLAGKSLKIHTRYDARQDTVIADAARLQQVFWNLVRNATKFTPDGGEITIRTWNQDRMHISVEVKDNGFGIPAEVLPRLFNMFEQGEVSITQHFGGLGLGLSVSKAIVDMHGGTISAESPGRGGGATFTVVLSTTQVQNPQAGAPAGQITQLPAIRLLLVEDHRDTANVLARLLGKSGCVVATAANVQEALGLLAGEHFDLLISDIGLPDATGLELMREARQRYKLKGIALSGYGMEEDIRKSADAGFSDHLVKPINIQQLRGAIHRIFPTPAA